MKVQTSKETIITRYKQSLRNYSRSKEENIPYQLHSYYGIVIKGSEFVLELVRMEVPINEVSIFKVSGTYTIVLESRVDRDDNII